MKKNKLFLLVFLTGVFFADNAQAMYLDEGSIGDLDSTIDVEQARRDAGALRNNLIYSKRKLKVLSAKYTKLYTKLTDYSDDGDSGIEGEAYDYSAEEELRNNVRLLIKDIKKEVEKVEGQIRYLLYEIYYNALMDSSSIDELFKEGLANLKDGLDSVLEKLKKLQKDAEKMISVESDTLPQAAALGALLGFGSGADFDCEYGCGCGCGCGSGCGAEEEESEFPF